MVYCSRRLLSIESNDINVQYMHINYMKLNICRDAFWHGVIAKHAKPITVFLFGRKSTKLRWLKNLSTSCLTDGRTTFCLPKWLPIAGLNIQTKTCSFCYCLGEKNQQRLTISTAVKSNSIFNTVKGTGHFCNYST